MTAVCISNRRHLACLLSGHQWRFPDPWRRAWEPIVCKRCGLSL